LSSSLSSSTISSSSSSSSSSHHDHIISSSSLSRIVSISHNSNHPKYDQDSKHTIDQALCVCGSMQHTNAQALEW
jgi:hypothetical protein